jgi:hypothetical protein
MDDERQIDSRSEVLGGVLLKIQVFGMLLLLWRSGMPLPAASGVQRKVLDAEDEGADDVTTFR